MTVDGWDGVAGGGRWGFAASGEVVLAPMEYEWGIRCVGGTIFRSGTRFFGFFEQNMGRACLKFGESRNFAPLLNFRPTAGRWLDGNPRCPK